MALTENGGGNDMVMPVAPMYGGGSGFGGGWGGDNGWWIILLFLFALGGWGNGFGGGYGGGGGDCRKWRTEINVQGNLYSGCHRGIWERDFHGNYQSAEMLLFQSFCGRCADNY